MNSAPRTVPMTDYSEEGHPRRRMILSFCA